MLERLVFLAPTVSGLRERVTRKRRGDEQKPDDERGARDDLGVADGRAPEPPADHARREPRHRAGERDPPKVPAPPVPAPSSSGLSSDT